jgi:hypothetical protein
VPAKIKVEISNKIYAGLLDAKTMLIQKVLPFFFNRLTISQVSSFLFS